MHKVISSVQLRCLCCLHIAARHWRSNWNDSWRCDCNAGISRYDNRTRLQVCWFTTLCYHTVSKNTPTLASCSFDKHRLILIILGKQHQHTFKNDIHIKLSLSLHFYVLHLLLDSCDVNDTNHNVFSSVDCWWLWRAGCVGLCLWKEPIWFSRCSKWCPFAFRHACNRFLHWPTALLTFCDMPAHVSISRCFKSLVSQTCILCTHSCTGPQIL